MKLEIPIIVGFDDLDSLLDDLKKLQTYKLFEGDEMVLVNIEDVAKVLMDHVKAKKSVKGDTISRKAVYDAVECMRFASDRERTYAYSMMEQIPTAESNACENACEIARKSNDMSTAQPETNCSEFPNNSDTISRQAAIDAISKIKRTDNWQAAVSMALLDLPSAQPEIIRCKDCKHQTVFHYTDKRFKDPDRYVYGCDLTPDCCYLNCFDSYCSEAERRTDG